LQSSLSTLPGFCNKSLLDGRSLVYWRRPGTDETIYN
jgi:hypothetical protein